MDEVDVACINDKYYVNIDDFASHLNQMVDAVNFWTHDDNPEGCEYVTETLKTVIETLEGFKTDV